MSDVKIEHELVAPECDRGHPVHYFDLDLEEQYPPPCMYCAYEMLREAHDPCAHSHHWWFQRSRPWGWLVSNLYAAGVIAGSSTIYDAHCHGCRGRLSWSGKRLYLLWLPREWWECLRRGHLRGDDAGLGMCGKCMPCPSCGSTKVGPFYACADCGGPW